jgi:sulfur relay protein TusB/DsrH
MILHLVNKPAAFSECIAHLAAGDSVLLIEQAANNEAAKQFHSQLHSSSDITLYVLQQNTTQTSEANSCFASITMNDFVALSIDAEKVVSWN